MKIKLDFHIDIQMNPVKIIVALEFLTKLLEVLEDVYPFAVMEGELFFTNTALD